MDHSLQHHQEVEQADKSETVIHMSGYGNSAIISITSEQSVKKKRKEKGNNIEWGFQTYYNIILLKDFEFSLVVSWLLTLYNLIIDTFFFLFQKLGQYRDLKVT